MPSIGAICTGIHLAMESVAGIKRVQNYDELTEGMNTLPTIQVYPERWDIDPGGETDRSSFVDAATGQPGVRQTEVLVRVDLYVRQRSHLNEDWREAINLANVLNDKLEEQGTCPPLFGVVGIQSFSWTAQRVYHDYATHDYSGFRFELTLRIF